MKKIIIFILICLMSLLIIYSTEKLNNYKKVLKVESPVTIYIDYNNNLIFDEKEPFFVKNIYYIEPNTNLKNTEYLKNFSEDEKFLLSYLEKELIKRTINEKYIKYSNDNIYINNKNYKDILLDSNLFYTDSLESKKKLYERIKSENINDYVIINTRSKKYHKINCEKGKASREYKLIKKDSLPKEYKPCKYCHLDNDNKLFKINKPKINTANNHSEYYEQPKIKLFFLSPYRIKKPLNVCNTKACLELKKEINNASYSIDIALYGIDNQSEIYNAIVNAYKRGIKIRWVTDYNKKYINYYKDTLQLQKIIKSYNTDENYEKQYACAIMHNKFFIFDKEKVWTGSSNISNTGLTGFNANYSILIESKELANIYLSEFEKLYSGKFHTLKEKSNKNTVILDKDTKIKALFSPQDKILINHIIPLINNAEKYIYIPIFYITSYDIANALKKAKLRGIDIKIINDSTNAHNKYSIHKKLRQNGISVKTENYAGKMHMKAMIIDDKISVIGSMNFTKSANNKNDENVLIIYNQNISKYLKNTFLYMWENIPDKYLNYDPLAESFESVGSCQDGIDNDFDGKIDKEDDGCKIN